MGNRHEQKSINNNPLVNRIIFLLASLVRIIYVAITPISARQHDEGYYTSLLDASVNPGHIGYIEYLVKFRHLPDFNPFDAQSYYHPPLYHFIGAAIVDSAHRMGLSDATAFKLVQWVTCIFSILTLIVVLKILRYFCSEERIIAVPYALIALHPGCIYMAGFINNDMLTTLFVCLSMYYCLKWIRDNKPFDLYMTSLSVGLGMFAKPNTVVIAIPIGFCMLTRLLRGNTASKIRRIKEYAIFAIISLPLGLWWHIRNYIRFHVTPGVPSADAVDLKYIAQYSLFERLVLPSELHLHYPFHSYKGSYSCNTWLIAFKTSVFAECWPDIDGALLTIPRITLVFAFILGLSLAVLSVYVPIVMIRRGQIEVGTFLLIGYISTIITFIMFVLKYPYTCSADFRYIPTTVLYGGISVGLLLKSLPGKRERLTLSIPLIVFAVLALFTMFFIISRC